MEWGGVGWDNNVHVPVHTHTGTATGTAHSASVTAGQRGSRDPAYVSGNEILVKKPLTNQPASSSFNTAAFCDLSNPVASTSEIQECMQKE